MNVYSIRCPQCNGSLDIEEGRDRCYCSYCGSQIFIDDGVPRLKIKIENAKEAGYQFEQGRMQAQMEMPTGPELAAKVKDLLQPACRLEDLGIRAQNLTASISYNEMGFNKVNSFLYMAGNIVIPVIVALLFISGGTEESFLANGLFGILAGAGTWFGIKIYRELKSRFYASRIRDYKAQLEQLQQAHEEILRNYDFSITPEEYRNEDAMRFIFEALASSRASTIEQAAMQYEYHSQQDEKFRMQQQQLEMQSREIAELRRRQDELAGRKRRGLF